MYCRNCGQKLADGDKFCSSCGAKTILAEEMCIRDRLYDGQAVSLW